MDKLAKILALLSVVLITGCVSPKVHYVKASSQKNVWQNDTRIMRDRELQIIERSATAKMNHTEFYMYKQLRENWSRSTFHSWLNNIIKKRSYTPAENAIPFCDVALETVALNTYVLKHHKKSYTFKNHPDFGTVDPKWFWRLRAKCTNNSEQLDPRLRDKKIPDGVGHFFKVD